MSNNAARDPLSRPVSVGIVGAGNRGIRCLGTRIAELTRETNMVVTAVADTSTLRRTEAVAELRRQFARRGRHDLLIAEYANHEELVAASDVDIVLVTTPQYAHRLPTLAALSAGKHTYCDKPIAHTLEDARAISIEESARDTSIVLGFTRRYERTWREAYRVLESGDIGSLVMLQIRANIKGDVYFHKFYRRREWSGGVLNEKCAHHFDVFNWFAGSRPVSVAATGGTAVFIPEENGPKRCLECGRDCPYRVEESTLSESRRSETDEIARVDNCVYLPGADIVDHAHVDVAYGNGVTASLFFSIFNPHADDEETLELVGTKGRILLNRHTGRLDVIAEHGKRRYSLSLSEDGEFTSSHFGADLELIRHIRDWYDGGAAIATAADGLVATSVSMAAIESIEQGGRRVELSAN